MDIKEKYEILKNWIMKKYNQPDYFNDNTWLFYNPKTNHLRLIPSMFIKWQELLGEGYSEEELINYFIEIIRYYLPELKETKLYFSIDPNDNVNYKII